MKNILKIFAPIALAILIGSLTLVFGQTGGGRRTADAAEEAEFRRRF